MSDLPPVVIVGAGPAGMTAALDLAHYGIPSLLLDEDTLHTEGSRAIAYHWSALAVWEKLGAAQAILSKGIAWSHRHTYYHEKEVYTQSFAPPLHGALPSFLNLQQYYVERFLLDRIEAQPLIDLRWNHRVTSVSQADDSVTLEVETPAGPCQFSAQYVLACDGPRSTMRKLLALDFPGRSYEDRFLIADVRASLDLPPEPRFFFNHPTNPGYTVLIHPQPDGVWRMDWQIGALADVERERSPERMEARIRALIGDLPYEIVWLSDYRFHQRLLEQFRHGRVFFAGDAAHLVAPFGARGMNSAIQDVENLVWKLAFVLRGIAPESLLDSYQPERWPAQQENQRITDRTMLFMSPPNPWRRFLRDNILRLSAFYPPARRWVDSGKMSEPFVYTRTPLLIPDDDPARVWRGAPTPGAQLPDTPIDVQKGKQVEHTHLRRILGSGFVVLFFAMDTETGREMYRAVEAEKDAVPLAVCPVCPSGMDGGTAILDPDGRLSKLFAAQPGTAFILRPDRHLAARRHRASPETVIGLTKKLLAGLNRTPGAQIKS
jgi:3-(3-hydroxy-phenyl)propionate hydroxylase